MELFGADLRSLAAFRIVLAVLVLADLTSRATDLYAHYTDEGILPRTVLLEEVLNRWAFSLNLMNGEPFFQGLLFGIAALAGLGLLVGYRTRLMTFVVWVLLLSIQWRNPLVNGGGEVLLRMLLFWGMFLPLGAYWSVDRALKVAAPRLSIRFLSMATVGLFMQIAFMYWFTAVLKSSQEWQVDGTALYYVLSIDQIATPIGAYLYQFPALLKVLTFATLGLEAYGPFLLFFPFFTGPVRTGAVLAFMGLHFGIWLTMDIGIFPWISAFCMVCFLPGWFWDRAIPKLRAVLPKQPSITHTLQHGMTRLVRAYWSPLRERLYVTVGAGQPSVAGTATHDDEPASHARRKTAPSAASDTKTKGQSETRPAAKTTAGQEPWHNGAAGSEPVTLRSSLATNLLAFLVLLYIFFWNVTTVSELKMPERLVPFSSLFGLEQSWGMFAPEPLKEDGWYVIPGALRNGQQVDLMGVTRDDFSLRAVSWEKPRYVPSTFKNEHWRKYLENIRVFGELYDGQYLHLGRYICREWNAHHTGSEQLTTFQITYMLETTLTDYQSSTPEKWVLWDHTC